MTNAKHPSLYRTGWAFFARTSKQAASRDAPRQHLIPLPERPSAQGPGPSWFFAPQSAPCLSSSSTMEPWPLSAATWRAVQPRSTEATYSSCLHQRLGHSLYKRVSDLSPPHISQDVIPIPLQSHLPSCPGRPALPPQAPGPSVIFFASVSALCCSSSSAMEPRSSSAA